ncbi:putative metal-nicotianamine transporter YSL9 [Acorus gramineus]|uniref:Metal-nicotianamine transporter YSL9 n=1 Tax=Acorus gramineus TaxID=55184 RepID=A0AAV9A0Z9_ACOGR|nr:putative metal-nicotianamine transporter YSL9 [Acorus gramineus]
MWPTNYGNPIQKSDSFGQPKTEANNTRGFGSYLLGLNKRTYEQAGIDTEGNTPGSYKEPGIGWMTAFLFIVSFVGLLALVPLRKIMIIDYKLSYPSGTATAVLINGFHTPQGDNMAKYSIILFFIMETEQKSMFKPN